MQAKWIAVLVVAPLLVIGAATAIILRQKHPLPTSPNTREDFRQNHADASATPIQDRPVKPIKQRGEIKQMSTAPILSQAKHAARIPQNTPKELGSVEMGKSVNALAKRMIKFFNDNSIEGHEVGETVKIDYQLLDVDVRKSDSLIRPIVGVIRIKRTRIDSRGSYQDITDSEFTFEVAPDNSKKSGWLCTKATDQITFPENKESPTDWTDGANGLLDQMAIATGS